MSTPQVTIPPVIEGYSDIRAVWYSPTNSTELALTRASSIVGDNGPDVFDLNRNTQQQVQSTLIQQQGNAKSQLRQLSKKPKDVTADNGRTLHTDGENDVAQMSWHKEIDSPAGVMSLVLFPRRNYVDVMQPEDVIMVYGRGDKNKPETLIAMISIDSVRLSRTVDGSGATVERVNVTGRDLGKLLMETPTVYDQAFGGKTIQNFFTVFARAFTVGCAAGGPSLVVQTMLATFFSLRQNFVTLATGAELPSQSDSPQTVGPLRSWRFPGQPHLSMFSFIDTSSFVQTPMVGAQPYDAALLQNGANLWQLCDTYANRIVNEFFIDTRDLVDNYDAAHKRAGYFAEHFLQANGADNTTQQQTQAQRLARTMALAPELLVDQNQKTNTLSDIAAKDFSQSTTSGNGAGAVVALVHRQMPYDTFSFYLLPTSVVYETEVFDVALEHGSHDILNYFRIRFPEIVVGVQQDLQFGTAINRSSIEAHGIRRFDGESTYPFLNDKKATPDGNGVGSISDYRATFEYYMSLVTCWYAYNERLKSGTISMRFRPDIRIGTRLTFVYTHRGMIRVDDYYVEMVSHTYGAGAGQSRTNVELVRGVTRTDPNSVGDSPESNLMWSHDGRSLDPDPYETVISEDIFTTSSSIEITPDQVAPGDP